MAEEAEKVRLKSEKDYTLLYRYVDVVRQIASKRGPVWESLKAKEAGLGSKEFKKFSDFEKLMVKYPAEIGMPGITAEELVKIRKNHELIKANFGLGDGGVLTTANVDKAFYEYEKDKQEKDTASSKGVADAIKSLKDVKKDIRKARRGQFWRVLGGVALAGTTLGVLGLFGGGIVGALSGTLAGAFSITSGAALAGIITLAGFSKLIYNGITKGFAKIRKGYTERKKDIKTLKETLQTARKQLKEALQARDSSLSAARTDSLSHEIYRYPGERLIEGDYVLDLDFAPSEEIESEAVPDSEVEISRATERGAGSPEAEAETGSPEARVGAPRPAVEDEHEEEEDLRSYDMHMENQVSDHEQRRETSVEEKKGESVESLRGDLVAQHQQQREILIRRARLVAMQKQLDSAKKRLKALKNEVSGWKRNTETVRQEAIAEGKTLAIPASGYITSAEAKIFGLESASLPRVDRALYVESEIKRLEAIPESLGIDKKLAQITRQDLVEAIKSCDREVGAIRKSIGATKGKITKAGGKYDDIKMEDIKGEGYARETSEFAESTTSSHLEELVDHLEEEKLAVQSMLERLRENRMKNGATFAGTEVDEQLEEQLQARLGELDTAIRAAEIAKNNSSNQPGVLKIYVSPEQRVENAAIVSEHLEGMLDEKAANANLGLFEAEPSEVARFEEALERVDNGADVEEELASFGVMSKSYANCLSKEYQTFINGGPEKEHVAGEIKAESSFDFEDAFDKAFRTREGKPYTEKTLNPTISKKAGVFLETCIREGMSEEEAIRKIEEVVAQKFHKIIKVGRQQAEQTSEESQEREPERVSQEQRGATAEGVKALSEVEKRKLEERVARYEAEKAEIEAKLEALDALPQQQAEMEQLKAQISSWYEASELAASESGVEKDNSGVFFRDSSDTKISDWARAHEGMLPTQQEFLAAKKRISDLEERINGLEGVDKKALKRRIGTLKAQITKTEKRYVEGPQPRKKTRAQKGESESVQTENAPVTEDKKKPEGKAQTPAEIAKTLGVPLAVLSTWFAEGRKPKTREEVISILTEDVERVLWENGGIEGVAKTFNLTKTERQKVEDARLTKAESLTFPPDFASLLEADQATPRTRSELMSLLTSNLDKFEAHYGSILQIKNKFKLTDSEEQRLISAKNERSIENDEEKDNSENETANSEETTTKKPGLLKRLFGRDKKKSQPKTEEEMWATIRSEILASGATTAREVGALIPTINMTYGVEMSDFIDSHKQQFTEFVLKVLSEKELGAENVEGTNGEVENPQVDKPKRFGRMKESWAEFTAKVKKLFAKKEKAEESEVENPEPEEKKPSRLSRAGKYLMGLISKGKRKDENERSETEDSEADETETNELESIEKKPSFITRIGSMFGRLRRKSKEKETEEIELELTEEEQIQILEDRILAGIASGEISNQKQLEAILKVQAEESGIEAAFVDIQLADPHGILETYARFKNLDEMYSSVGGDSLSEEECIKKIKKQYNARAKHGKLPKLEDEELTELIERVISAKIEKSLDAELEDSETPETESEGVEQTEVPEATPLDFKPSEGFIKYFEEKGLPVPQTEEELMAAVSGSPAVKKLLTEELARKLASQKMGGIEGISDRKKAIIEKYGLVKGQFEKAYEGRLAESKRAAEKQSEAAQKRGEQRRDKRQEEREAGRVSPTVAAMKGVDAIFVGTLMGLGETKSVNEAALNELIQKVAKQKGLSVNEASMDSIKRQIVAQGIVVESSAEAEVRDEVQTPNPQQNENGVDGAERNETAEEEARRKAMRAAEEKDRDV